MQYVSGRKINQDFGIPGITTSDTVVNVDGRIAVGIGTSATTDIDTNQIRIRDNIIDSRGVIGSMGYFLTKDVEGVTWTNVPPLGNNSIFLAEDGDILNNIGLQTYTGLNFISDQLLGITTNPDNPGFADIRIDPRWFRDRTPGGGGGIYTTGTVGIGLTQPRLGPVGILTDVKLDVLGDAIFSGVVSATSFTGEFNVDTKDLNVSGIASFTGGTDNVIGDTNTGIVQIDGGVGIDKNVSIGASLFVNNNVGIGTSTNLDGNALTVNGGDVNILGDDTTVKIGTAVTISNGIVSATTFDGKFLDVEFLNVTGIATIKTGIITDLSVSGFSTFSNDVNIGAGETTAAFFDVSTGNVGIGTSTNLDGNALTINGGNVDILGDDTTVKIGTAVTISNGIVSATTFDGKFLDVEFLNVTGIATINTGIITNLSVSGLSTFNDTARFDGEVNILDDLFVSGNISVGGTGVTLDTESIRIEGKELLIGFTTTITPNDTTANAAGIAVASTEGYFLADLQVPGINTTPNTYKQFKWFKNGTFVGQGTDAFISNQPISIGGTQIGNGQLFAVGNNINFTEDKITAPTFVGNLTGTASTASFATTAFTLDGRVESEFNVAFAQTAGIATNVIGGIGSLTSLNVTGISTLGTVKISAGIVTATSGIVTYFGEFNGPLTGTASTASFATTAFTLNNRVESEFNVAFAQTAGIATNVIGGIGSLSSLSVSGISTLGTVKIAAGIVTSTTGTAVSFFGEFNGPLTGTASTASFATTAFTLNNRVESEFNVAFAQTAGIATNVIGGIASVTQLNVTGISTLGTVKIAAGIVTSTTGTAVSFFGNLTGTASTASFATTAFTLDGRVESEFNVAFAQTAGIATNVIGGIGSLSSLSVSGISTLGTVKISAGVVTATTGIVTYYGDGQYLENIISGVGIQSSGTVIGTGFTTLNFIGVGNTIVSIGNTVNISINSSKSAGFAQTAGIATNLAGGAGGSIPYQSAADTTEFLSNGTVGQVLVSNGGTSGPSWANAASSGAIDGITIIDEVTTVGTANSVSILNFKGSAITATASGNISTITVTIPSIPDVNGSAGIASTARDVIGGIGSLTSLSVSGISTLGTVEINAGIITATTGIVTYYGDGRYLENIITNSEISNQSVAFAQTAGIATEATRLQNSRDFSITGSFVTASVISFDGTDDVALAATITTNSIELGTYTTGNYVQSVVSGNLQQISVANTTGEGADVSIEIANNPTLPGNVTVQNDLTVNGNLLIVGSGATVIVDDFKISDKNIIAGFTTNASGAEVSSDSTANAGGIAVASTVGNPLVDLTIAGIDTHPSTYKRLYWYQENAFAGLGTDAWLTNYALGVGTTQFPTGTYFAAGNVQITENDLSAVRNINASGVSTLGTVKIDAGIITSTTGTAVTYFGNLTGTASTASFATTSFSLNGVVASDLNVAFAQKSGISTNVIGGIASVTSLSVDTTGISTLGTVKIDAGIITSTTGTAVTYFGNLTGTASTASFATTSFSLNGVVASDLNVAFAQTAGIATNVIGGIASVTSLSVSGISTLGTVKIDAGIITSTTGTAVTYFGNLTGTASTASFATTSFSLNGVVASDLNVAFAQTAGIATNVIGGIGSLTSLSVSGISTLGTVKISAGIITSTTGTAVTYFGNLTGTASTASFATTSFSLNGVVASDLNVAFAQKSGISTNVIGGIGSLTSLSVNTTGISTLGTVKIDAGIITSTTGTAVTYFGNLTGTASTASFATTSFSLNGVVASDLNVAFAQKSGISTNVIGGIASVTSLSVDTTGISTLGTVKISAGIVTATSGIVTYFGEFNGPLTGTATNSTNVTVADESSDTQTCFPLFADSSNRKPST